MEFGTFYHLMYLTHLLVLPRTPSSVLPHFRHGGTLLKLQTNALAMQSNKFKNLNATTVVTIADLETLLLRLHTRNSHLLYLLTDIRTCQPYKHDPMKQSFDEFQYCHGHGQF